MPSHETRSDARPRYAYEDPATLAWTAQMFSKARRRRLARLAAERVETCGGDTDAA